MDFFNVVIRSILSLIVLFFMTKLLGKKQVSQLSLFDYVVGISIGNFASEMSINLQESVFNAMTATIVFGVCAYLISVLTLKSLKLRKFVIGVPTILIQHGKIIYENLKQTKFDINDLLEEARGNGYFDLNRIEENQKIALKILQENVLDNKIMFALNFDGEWQFIEANDIFYELEWGEKKKLKKEYLYKYSMNFSELINWMKRIGNW